MANKLSTIELIENTLEKIKPFIRSEGGDFDFVSFENGIVYIKFLGACVTCTLKDSTIENSIELILQEEVPGIIGVRYLTDEDETTRYSSKSPIKS
jgi:Fe-S cluster biogenesis protein NfuA